MWHYRNKKKNKHEGAQHNLHCTTLPRPPSPAPSLSLCPSCYNPPAAKTIAYWAHCSRRLAVVAAVRLPYYAWASQGQSHKTRGKNKTGAAGALPSRLWHIEKHDRKFIELKTYNNESRISHKNRKGGMCFSAVQPPNLHPTPARSTCNNTPPHAFHQVASSSQGSATRPPLSFLQTMPL